MRSTFAVTVLGLCLSPSCVAQVGKDSVHWDWSKPAKHHGAVVKVEVAQPGATSGGATGSGVIVRFERVSALPAGQAYCLTAAHVLESALGKSITKNGVAPPNQPGSKDEPKKPGETRAPAEKKSSTKAVLPAPVISVFYRSGEVSRKSQIVAIDEKRDVALLRVAVPKGTKPVRVASKAIKPGESLEFIGFGGGSDVKKPRHFNAFASAPTTGDLIYADTPLLPGDSGGAVFNEKKEVVGVISGGWIWWQGGIRNKVGQNIPATWPARACNVAPIRQLRPARARRRRR